MTDFTELYTRSWSAYATMINQAQQLERAAADLRRVASTLHLALDPPAREVPDTHNGELFTDSGPVKEQ